MLATWKDLMIAGILLVGLAGCDDGYENQRSKLEAYARDHQVGDSPDYWLVKRSFGIDDKVMLVFGYMDDYAACSELVETLNSRYPAARYACRRAN